MAHISQDADSFYLTVRIPKANNLPQRVVAAMVGTYGPVPADPSDPLGKTPAMTDQEFAYQCLRKMLVQAVRSYESAQAATAAAVAKQQQVDTETATID